MKLITLLALVLFFSKDVFGRQHVIKGTLSMKTEEPVVLTPLVEEAVIDAAFTCPPIVPCPVQVSNCPEQQTCPVAKECPTPPSCPTCPTCPKGPICKCPVLSKPSNCDSW